MMTASILNDQSFLSLSLKSHGTNSTLKTLSPDPKCTYLMQKLKQAYVLQNPAHNHS